MTNRDLCTLADVKNYVPGYSSTESDPLLTTLITSESEAIHDETGRLILPFADQPETRAFPIRNHEHGHRWHRGLGYHRHQRVEIDDLASAGDTDITVELIATDETTTTTINRPAYRPLYGHNRRQPKAAWEPVTALEFPTQLGAPLLVDGQTILVTGNFGFPSIPPFIVQACAKRVILRYASDAASAGTQLAAVIQDIHLAGLFASARDDVGRLQTGVYIA